MKRRQEAAEEAERQRLQAEAEAKAAAEAQAEAARIQADTARDTSDAPGSPKSEHEAGKSTLLITNPCFLYQRHFFLPFLRL